MYNIEFTSDELSSLKELIELYLDRDIADSVQYNGECNIEYIRNMIHIYDKLDDAKEDDNNFVKRYRDEYSMLIAEQDREEAEDNRIQWQRQNEDNF